MLPYAARQLIWMLQIAVQLILAMSKGIYWVMQMVRLFIYVAMVWIFFLSTVMWYMTSANIIRLVAYRSSETTRRRNVLRVLEEEGVDLGPLFVREQRRYNDRSLAGRRSLKDTHMGPGHGLHPANAGGLGLAELSAHPSALSAEGAATATTVTTTASAITTPTATATRRRRLLARDGTGVHSESGAQEDQDSLGPAASAPQLRPGGGAPRRGGPPGARMYANLTAVERLLNLNPADGSALKSLPYTRKTGSAVAGGGGSTSGTTGPAHGRRRPPPRRHPHSANTSVAAEGLPLPSPLAARRATNNGDDNGDEGAGHYEDDGRPLPVRAHRSEEVHYYADLPPHTDDSVALTDEMERGLLAAMSSSVPSSSSTSAEKAEAKATGVDGHTNTDGSNNTDGAGENVRGSAPLSPSVAPRAGGVHVGGDRSSDRLSPSPSRPYPPRRMPAGSSPGAGGGPAAAQRRRPPPPPPHVRGVAAASGEGAQAAEAHAMARLSARSSPRMRPQPPPPPQPQPFASASAPGSPRASLANPKSLSADLEEEDEEDRMNLHNRATVDIILPVPMDSLMKTLDYANRNTTLRRKRFPVVVLMTGGVWIIGSHMWGMLLARVLAQRGYVVFCPDYRNFPQTTMEGMVLDVSDAIAWVLNNAERYNGDLEDVTIIGHSCGAHLSMMSLLSQAHLAAVRQSLPHGGQLPAPSEVAYNVPRYNPRRAIHRFVGLSGMYDVEGLEPHFSSKGLNRPVLARIAGGRENLARYSLHAYFDPYRRGSTGELLPDTIFDFLPARFFFLHGERDKVTPPSQSASIVGVMRQAQRDCTLKRLTRQEEYRRHIRNMQQQQQQRQVTPEKSAHDGTAASDATRQGLAHMLDGEDAEPTVATADTRDGSAARLGVEMPDPLPLPPADMEYVLILGAGHTDAMVEECLVGGRSCCVDFLCDYEAASQPAVDRLGDHATLARHFNDIERSTTMDLRSAEQADRMPRVCRPGLETGNTAHPASLGSSVGLSGSVQSGRPSVTPPAAGGGVGGVGVSAAHGSVAPTSGMPMDDYLLGSPAWSESRLSVSLCTPAGAGPASAVSGSTTGARRYLGRPPSNVSLSALSAQSVSFSGDNAAGAHGLPSGRRSRSPAVPHEVPPDAWLPMSVPREQWPVALRIASMISPF